MLPEGIGHSYADIYQSISALRERIILLENLLLKISPEEFSPAVQSIVNIILTKNK